MEWITLEEHLDKRLGPKGTPERDAYDYEVEEEIKAGMACEETPRPTHKTRTAAPAPMQEGCHYAASTTTA